MLSKGYYRAHLEKILDYIAIGPGIWWHKDDTTGNTVFHDGPDEPETRPEGPPLYHFQSTSIKWLHQHLGEKWQQCVSNRIGFIPLTRLTVYDDDGNLKAIYTEREPTEKEESNEGLQLELIPDVSDTPHETCQLLSESSDCADMIPVSLKAIPDEEIACDLAEDLSSSKLAAKDVTDTVTNEPPATSPNDPSDTREISQLENMTKDVPSKPSTPEDQCMKESNKSNSTYQTPLTTRTLVNKRVQGLTLQSQVLPKKLHEKMEQNITLKASLATTVSKIIGSTEDVVLLDKCRENVWKNPNSKANISSYELSLAKVQTKVLEEYSHIKSQLKS